MQREKNDVDNDSILNHSRWAGKIPTSTHFRFLSSRSFRCSLKICHSSFCYWHEFNNWTSQAVLMVASAAFRLLAPMGFTITSYYFSYDKNWRENEVHRFSWKTEAHRFFSPVSYPMDEKRLFISLGQHPLTGKFPSDECGKWKKKKRKKR